MPRPDVKTEPEEPLRGMDYGVPPRSMLMANPALMELWNEAKCMALAYLKLPRHGAFFDVPCVAMIFEHLEKGVRVFDLLKSWDCEPDSGRGTDISFTENRAANSYTIVLGPDHPEMVKRLVDPSMLEDYSVLTVGLAVGKTFTLSAHFRSLRDQPRNKPIVFAPGDKFGEVLLQHSVAKSDVQFFDHDTVSKDTIEYAMGAGETQRSSPHRIRPRPVDPVEIGRKRTRQLKKFFAVAAARLEHNPTFIKTAKRLSQNYERWQLVQAACNILCGEWFPELRTPDGRLDFYRAYDALRRHPEAVIDESALRKDFNTEVVESQIREDLIYLRDQVRPEAQEVNPVVTLRHLGLLR